MSMQARAMKAAGWTEEERGYGPKAGAWVSIYNRRAHRTQTVFLRHGKRYPSDEFHRLPPEDRERLLARLPRQQWPEDQPSPGT